MCLWNWAHCETRPYPSTTAGCCPSTVGVAPLRHLLILKASQSVRFGFIATHLIDALKRYKAEFKHPCHVPPDEYGVRCTRVHKGSKTCPAGSVPTLTVQMACKYQHKSRDPSGPSKPSELVVLPACPACPHRGDNSSEQQHRGPGWVGKLVIVDGGILKGNTEAGLLSQETGLSTAHPAQCFLSAPAPVSPDGSAAAWSIFICNPHSAREQQRR